MFYQMLCGESPIGEPRERSQRMDMSRFRNITPIRKLVPEIPLAVEKVLNRSMAMDAEQRYEKPAQMLVDLRKAIKWMEEKAAGGGSGEPADKETTVLLMESNSKLQDALRAHLKKHGYRVLIISDPKRCTQRLQDEDNLADVVIISTAVLGNDALDAYKVLTSGEKTSSIPIVLLMGQKQVSALDSVKLLPNQRKVAMPLKIQTLVAALNDLTGKKKA